MALLSHVLLNKAEELLNLSITFTYPKYYNSLAWAIDKPKNVSRSQKSKADDLVFIKIAMSNHPPTPTPRESFKEAR